jgi:hypothetical protein
MFHIEGRSLYSNNPFISMDLTELILLKNSGLGILAKKTVNTSKRAILQCGENFCPLWKKGSNVADQTKKSLTRPKK